MIRLLALCLLSPTLASAQSYIPNDAWFAEEDWRFDLGLTFNRFEQQVKTEIGGAAGERLVEETQFGVAFMGSYRIWGPFSVGVYAQYDAGRREAGRFQAFDADNAPITTAQTGGSFHELWVGPFLRLQWATLFVEGAYGALGLRFDEARTDLPSADGATDTGLLTSPAIAWYVATGGGIPLHKNVDLILRLTYRVRYYTRRTDSALANDVAHGTQNLTPFIGVAAKLY